MFNLPEEPRILKFFARLRNSGLRSFGSNSLVKVRFGSRLLTTIFARYSLPLAQATPVTRLPLTSTRCHVGVGDDLAAEGLERVAQRLGHRAHAAARETPGADRAVDVTHVVVQQHVGGAGRIRARAPCR